MNEKMASKRSLVGKLMKNCNTSKAQEIASSSVTTSPYFSPSNKHNKTKPLYVEERKKQLKEIDQFEIVDEKYSEAVRHTKEANVSSKKKIKVLTQNEANHDEKKIQNAKTSEVKSKKKIENDKWEPLNWKIVLDNIRNMRAESSAPVDTMGCHKCPAENVTGKEKRFSVLLSLMLSTRTRDEITYSVMNKINTKIIPLTPENVLKLEKSELTELLKPVAFYKTKAGYIIKTCQILIEKHNSDIPDSLDGLMNLTGVSSKISHICMNVAWNVVTGIGVDVHVHRISNRLGWVKKETKMPEDTRMQLESWAPKELWSEINHLLVGFGQTICKAIKPKCDTCLNNNFCPYYKTFAGNNLKKNVKKKNLEW